MQSEMQSENQPIKYNILKDGPGKKTQNYIIAKIFEENKDKWIEKSLIETTFALKWLMKDVSVDKSYTQEELIQNGRIPGDVQRQIRIFNDQYQKYGLERKEEEEPKTVYYKWSPIDTNQPTLLDGEKND